MRKEAKASGVSVHFGQLMTIASIKFYELADHLHKNEGAHRVQRGLRKGRAWCGRSLPRTRRKPPPPSKGSTPAWRTGRLPGNRATAADAVKAYVQALLSSKIQNLD